MPDVTGIVISGIMNFGNDADMIKAMAKDAIGCKAEDVKIPYDESQFARRRFINDVIVGKLTGSVRFSTQALIDTFYEFLEMPTEATKQMQAKDDLRDIERYLNNETRRPIVLGHPIINLCGANFECQMDFAFLGPHIVKTNKHKEGRKWVYDEEEVYLAEAVRIFPNKPAVKETSKILDVGIGTRLELYVMIKEMQKWVDAHKCAGGQPILLRASYYYLKKDREDDKHYSDNFFDGKGGNVISLSVIYSEDTMKAIDDIYAPKLREFLEGNSVLSGECKNCSSRMLCGCVDVFGNPLETKKKR